MTCFDSSNEGMTLSEFKRIFYMEYAHRMWGRSIGAVFFLPAIFFTYKGWIAKSLKPRLFIYGGLLAFQVILLLHLEALDNALKASENWIQDFRYYISTM